jgi:hypothetical protein
MRIPREWVAVISGEIVEELLGNKLVEPAGSKEKLLEAMEALILDELMVEDRLNDEVREILKQYEAEIEKGRMDFRKLFDLTKQKLVRERNIIL